MYGIFTYIWLISMVNVGKYAMHGWYGTCFFGANSFSNMERLHLPFNLWLWGSQESPACVSYHFVDKTYRPYHIPIHLCRDWLVKRWAKILWAVWPQIPFFPRISLQISECQDQFVEASVSLFYLQNGFWEKSTTPQPTTQKKQTIYKEFSSHPFCNPEIPGILYFL